jgi:DNA relaxase NicK
MENSCDKVNSKSKRKKASWNTTRRSPTIRIGNRSNSNYYSVYQKTKRINYDVYSEVNHGLKFELELKNQLFKSLKKFLCANQIEELNGFSDIS